MGSAISTAPPSKPSSNKHVRHHKHKRVKPRNEVRKEGTKQGKEGPAPHQESSLQVLSEGPELTETGLRDLTIAVLKTKREKGLVCVTSETGNYCLKVNHCSNHTLSIRCTFVKPENIRYMVSFRWKDFATLPGSGAEIACNFLNVTRTRDYCWVASLNHLNDNELKNAVLDECGELYRVHEAIGEFFLRKPTYVRALFQMLLEATRCWMWQEVAAHLTEGTELALEGYSKFGGHTAQLCLALRHLGRDTWGELYWTIRKQIQRKDGEAAVPFYFGGVQRGYLVDHKNNNEKCWHCIVAMITAMQLCFNKADVLEERVAAWSDDQWLSYQGEDGMLLPHSADDFRIDDFSVLLDGNVPKHAVELVMQLASLRNPTTRLLMGAASCLQNNNIGTRAQWFKWDLVPASLSLVSRVPEIVGDENVGLSLDERVAIVLPKIKDAMVSAIKPGRWQDYVDNVRSAQESGGLEFRNPKPWSSARACYEPVPCGSRAVGDLFEFGITAVRFTQPLIESVQFMVDGSFSETLYPVSAVSELRSGAFAVPESIAHQDERDVECLWVELREAEEEGQVLVLVTAVITTCGLRIELKSDWGDLGDDALLNWRVYDRPQNAPWKIELSSDTEPSL